MLPLMRCMRIIYRPKVGTTNRIASASEGVALTSNRNEESHAYGIGILVEPLSVGGLYVTIRPMEP